MKPDALTNQALERLAQRLKRVNSQLKLLSYSEVTRDCEILADKLLKEIPKSELSKFHFAGIPRGGFFVLGTLAYFLDIPFPKLITKLGKEPNLCIVDDCCLSGYRFSQMLEQTNSVNIIFAHLYSNPKVRHAILRREPRVKACYAANDLAEIGEGEDYQREHPSSNTPYSGLTAMDNYKSRYWMGITKLVAFPWTEPDFPIWDCEDGQFVKGWRFIAPRRCLKNLSYLKLPPKSLSVIEWDIGEGIVYGIYGNEIWLCNTHSEEVYALDGTAADIWRGLVVYRNTCATVSLLTERYEVSREKLMHDVLDFADILLECNLIKKL